MARTTEWEQLEMAEGDPKPAWPIPSAKPKFATWSLGGGRPFGCDEPKCARWHAGIDLVGIPNKALVVAPEDATVLAVDRGWSGQAKAIFLRTETGLFVVLGGVIKGSSKEFDVSANKPVRKGDRLGRVLGSYGMIHLETYRAESRRANSVWWKGQPPPDGLLNPTHYVERMVGDRLSLLRTVHRHEALRALGHYTGDVNAPWGEASKEALEAAQKALGVTADGVWGPNTEDAIIAALGEGKDCTEDICPPRAPSGAGESTSTPQARHGLWLAIAGLTAVGLTAGAVVMLRRRAA